VVTSVEEILTARRQSTATALGGAATDERISDYLAPWSEARVRRSRTNLAGATDNRYTRDLVPALPRSATPKLLIWGEDDGFQKVEYAERFVSEIPHTTLVRIPDAGHIPMENTPDRVARALADFVTA
jgi:pimeloyl-ACP methyl ester carboxylesterase